MDDENAGTPRGGQDIRAGPDRRLQTRDIVAERRAEPAWLQKIPLHIDDDKCHPAGIDGERLRLRRYGPHWQGGLPLLVPFLRVTCTKKSKIGAISAPGRTDLNAARARGAHSLARMTFFTNG